MEDSELSVTRRIYENAVCILPTLPPTKKVKKKPKSCGIGRHAESGRPNQVTLVRTPSSFSSWGREIDRPVCHWLRVRKRAGVSRAVSGARDPHCRQWAMLGMEAGRPRGLGKFLNQAGDEQNEGRVQVRRSNHGLGKQSEPVAA